MKNLQLSWWTRIVLIISGIMLIFVLSYPIWKIELSAPQYPEGLMMNINADGLGGDVAIINGLNHYIGMKTLHNEDFIEFKILPYIIPAFAAFFFLVAISGNRKLMIVLFTTFVLFGVLAMVDFWKWEYDYGHNLDPNAAIKVEGMSYQPPLIGYKQLLNFGAYSIPDKGGWLFISSGILLLFALIFEFKRSRKRKGVAQLGLLAIGMMLALTSCSNATPKPAKLNVDNCSFCKMTISDGRFVGQILTKKGRYYFFDDISCMIRFKKESKTISDADFYVSDFTNPSSFINLNEAILLKNEQVQSPMGGNIAAFPEQKKADEFTIQYKATPVLWKELTK